MEIDNKPILDAFYNGSLFDIEFFQKCTKLFYFDIGYYGGPSTVTDSSKVFIFHSYQGFSRGFQNIPLTLDLSNVTWMRYNNLPNSFTVISERLPLKFGILTRHYIEGLEFNGYGYVQLSFIDKRDDEDGIIIEVTFYKKRHISRTEHWKKVLKVETGLLTKAIK